MSAAFLLVTTGCQQHFPSYFAGDNRLSADTSIKKMDMSADWRLSAAKNAADKRLSAAKNAADNQLYIFPINQVYIQVTEKYGKIIRELKN